MKLLRILQLVVLGSLLHNAGFTAVESKDPSPTAGAAATATSITSEGLIRLISSVKEMFDAGSLTASIRSRLNYVPAGNARTGDLEVNNSLISKLFGFINQIHNNARASAFATLSIEEAERCLVIMQDVLARIPSSFVSVSDSDNPVVLDSVKIDEALRRHGITVPSDKTFFDYANAVKTFFSVRSNDDKKLAFVDTLLNSTLSRKIETVDGKRIGVVKTDGEEGNFIRMLCYHLAFAAEYDSAGVLPQVLDELSECIEGEMRMVRAFNRVLTNDIQPLLLKLEVLESDEVVTRYLVSLEHLALITRDGDSFLRTKLDADAFRKMYGTGTWPGDLYHNKYNTTDGIYTELQRIYGAFQLHVAKLKIQNSIIPALLRAKGDREASRRIEEAQAAAREAQARRRAAFMGQKERLEYLQSACKNQADEAIKDLNTIQKRVGDSVAPIVQPACEAIRAEVASFNAIITPLIKDLDEDREVTEAQEAPLSLQSAKTRMSIDKHFLDARDKIESQAATKIQTAFRGYKARKEFKVLKAEEAEREAVANAKADAFRKQKEDQRARTALQAWLKAAQQESAAGDIQRVWRGKKGRDKAKGRKAFIEKRKEAVSAFEKDARDLFDAFDVSRLTKNLEPLATFLNGLDTSQEDEAITEIIAISSQIEADADSFVKENEAVATANREAIEQAEDDKSLLSAVEQAAAWASRSRGLRFSLLESRMKSAVKEVSNVMRQFAYAVSGMSDGEHKVIASEVRAQWEDAVIATNNTIEIATSGKEFYAINFKELLSAAQRLTVIANAALELQDAVESISIMLDGDDTVPGVLLELGKVDAAEDIAALRKLASDELDKVKSSDAWKGKSADKNIARLAANAVKKVNDAVVEVIKKHGLEIDLSKYKKSVKEDITGLTKVVKKAFVETNGLFKKILAADRAKDARDKIIRLIEERKERILATISLIEKTSGSERFKHIQRLKQQLVVERLHEKLQQVIDEYFAKRAMPAEKDSAEAQLNKALSSLTEKLSSVSLWIDDLHEETLARMEKQAKTLMPYFKQAAKKLPTKRDPSVKKTRKAVEILEDDADKITPALRTKYEKLAGAQQDGETDDDYLKRVKAALSKSYKKHKDKAALKTSEASVMFEDETLRPTSIERATEESDKFSYGATVDQETWLASRKSLSLTALKRSIKGAHDAVMILVKDIQAQLTELKGDDRLTSDQRQKPNQAIAQAKELLKIQETSTDKEELEGANETILGLKNELIQLNELLSGYITSAREELITSITAKKESLKKLYDEIIEAGKFTSDKAETQRRAASHFDEAKIRKISTDTLANMREFIAEIDRITATLGRIMKAQAGAIIYEPKEEDVKELSVRRLLRERSKMIAPTIATTAAEKDLGPSIDVLRAIHENTVLARRSKRDTTTDITTALKQLDDKPAQRTLRSADTKNTAAVLTALLNLLDKAKGLTAANWYGDHVSFAVLNEDTHRESAQKALGVEVWKLLMRLSTDDLDLIDTQFTSTKLPKITPPAAPVATAGVASTADAASLTKSAPAALTSPGKPATVTVPTVDPKQLKHAETLANALVKNADTFTAAKTNPARTAAWAKVFDGAGVAAAINELTDSAHPTLITDEVTAIIDALKAGVSTGGFSGVANVGTKRIPYKDLYVKVKSILDKTPVTPASPAGSDVSTDTAESADSVGTADSALSTAAASAPALDPEATAVVRLFEARKADLSGTSTPGQKRTAFNAIIKELTSKYARTGGTATDVARKITAGLSTLDQRAIGRELQRLGIQLPTRDTLVGSIWDFFMAALNSAAQAARTDAPAADDVRDLME